MRKLEIQHHPQTTEKKSATAKAATVKDQPADRVDTLEAKINQLTTEVRSMKKKEYSYTPIPQPYIIGHQDNHIREADRKMDTEEDIGNIPDSLSPKLHEMSLRNVRVPG